MPEITPRGLRKHLGEDIISQNRDGRLRGKLVEDDGDFYLDSPLVWVNFKEGWGEYTKTAAKRSYLREGSKVTLKNACGVYRIYDTNLPKDRERFSN